jgi:hypothetical protein
MNKANSSPVFSVRGCGSLLVCTVIYNNLKIIYFTIPGKFIILEQA